MLPSMSVARVALIAVGAIKPRTGSTVCEISGEIHRSLARSCPFMSDCLSMADESGRLSYGDFQRVDIRVGRVVDVQDFPEARKPAYKLRVDFGPEIGVKRSSAQVTKYYSKEQLLNRLVLAVVNFPPKQIGPFMSEVLTLGVPDPEGAVVLLTPEREVPIGGRLF